MHRVPHRACTRDIPWLHRGGYRRLQRRYVSTEYRNVPCPANLSVAQRMGIREGNIQNTVSNQLLKDRTRSFKA